MNVINFSSLYALIAPQRYGFFEDNQLKRQQMSSHNMYMYIYVLPLLLASVHAPSISYHVVNYWKQTNKQVCFFEILFDVKLADPFGKKFKLCVLICQLSI